MKRFLVIFLLVISFIAVNLIFCDDKDACLDSGICKEGMTVNTANGSIVINQNTCLENDGKWLNNNVCSFYY